MREEKHDHGHDEKTTRSLPKIAFSDAKTTMKATKSPAAIGTMETMGVTTWRSWLLIHERLALLSDAPALLRFLFTDDLHYQAEDLIPKKKTLETARSAISRALPIVDDLLGLSEEEAEQLLRSTAEEAELKLGDFLMPLRVALTGGRVSPPLTGSMLLLGADRVKERLTRAAEIAANSIRTEE